MSKSKLVIGDQTITEAELRSGNIFISNSLACDELTIDTLDAELDCGYEQGTLFVPSGASSLVTADNKTLYTNTLAHVQTIDPTLFVYGQAVEYWLDNEIYAVFYMSSVERVGRGIYDISCVSAIGLLDNTMHYGGIYTGQTVETVLADIIGGVVEYTLDPAFKNMAVYGWLPIATRRENLHQLLFAEGASVRKSTTGALDIVALTNETAVNIPEDRIYINGTISHRAPATKVTVNEHSYTTRSTDETVTLYEGEIAAESIVTPGGSTVQGAIIQFDEPMYDLTATNATLYESGVNYAVLGASSDCTLTGKKYTHITRQVTRTSSNTGLKENEATVTDATLVSMLNSENVADRVMAYYGSSKTVNAGIVVNEEKPGDNVTFIDPFGDATTGFIKSMNITMSRILKSVTELVEGYIPPVIGNLYQHSELLTEDGTWTVPDGVTKIRAVLIGGGHGGYLGNPGGESSQVDYDTPGPSTSGGEPGDPGEGGRVYVVTMEVTAGQTISYTIGLGGAGATQTADAQEGGASIFGAQSSAQGVPSSNGYINILDGSVYAVAGGQGVAGGHGNLGGTDVVWDGVTYTTGRRGESASGSYNGTQKAYGGFGGGPAAGANGYNGRAGLVTENTGPGWAQGGKGGDGATPIKAPNGTGIGQGGYGGHGGGGAGGGGAAGNTNSTWMAQYHSAGAAGTPGKGGEGGDGAPGGIIIYY